LTGQFGKTNRASRSGIEKKLGRKGNKTPRVSRETCDTGRDDRRYEYILDKAQSKKISASVKALAIEQIVFRIE
jgi:hypothetical protein